MRISRPCYDKPHRCPGWAGGGMRYAKFDLCDDGRLYQPYRRRYWLGARCSECGVYALPIAVQWLDWRWLKYFITSPYQWPRPHRWARNLIRRFR